MRPAQCGFFVALMVRSCLRGSIQAWNSEVSFNFREPEMHYFIDADVYELNGRNCNRNPKFEIRIKDDSQFWQAVEQSLAEHLKSTNFQYIMSSNNLSVPFE